MLPNLSRPTHRTEPEANPETPRVRNPLPLRDGVYRALHAALDCFPGGIQQLAEDMGSNRADTYLRVMRKEDSKGQLQRAFLDFLGFVAADEEAAFAFTVEWNKLIGLEPPVRRKRVTLDEIGRAWLKQLDALPVGEREGRRSDMAAALGIPVEALR